MAGSFLFLPESQFLHPSLEIQGGYFLVLTCTWYCEVSCMMTLELEYFFLCSGWRHRCHAPQRVRPSLVGLDPWGPRGRIELG